MNYYKEIKNKILDNEIYEKVKDLSKERHRVLTYFEIGRLLHEAGKHYGDSIIKKYSIQLKKEFGKKYSTRSLFKMRQFYLLFTESKQPSVISKSQKVPTHENIMSNNPYLKDNNSQKVPTPCKDITSYLSVITKLNWSHYVRILSLKDQNEILYYINLVISERLSVRQLETRIKTKEYYRLDEKTRNKLIKLEETTAIDYVKNPILIENKNKYDDVSKKLLQTLILEDLPLFLKN